eukprot:scaffold205438_cov33-Tisochrysis_lutea.AAC.1
MEASKLGAMLPGRAFQSQSARCSATARFRFRFVAWTSAVSWKWTGPADPSKNGDKTEGV